MSLLIKPCSRCHKIKEAAPNSERRCIDCYDYNHQPEGNAKNNPLNNPSTNGEPYREALAWVHTNYPGRRVGKWAWDLWEAAYPGKKWADLRTTQQAIDAGEEGVDIDFRESTARIFGDKKPKTTRMIVGGEIEASTEHFDIQAAIEKRVPQAPLEQKLIDVRFKSLGIEIKPHVVVAPFREATGKLMHLLLADEVKEAAFLTQDKPKADGMVLKMLGRVQASYLWLNRKADRLEIFNEQFAGPDTREFVALYNEGQ